MAPLSKTAPTPTRGRRAPAAAEARSPERTTRAPALREFAVRTLEAYGAAVREVGGGCVEVDPGPLAAILGRDTVVLAFDRATAVRHASAHLVATGSPFLGRLLAIARQEGAVTRWKYAARVAPPTHSPGGRDALGAPGRRTATRLYRLHVLVTLHAADHAQQIITLVWDPQARATLTGAELPGRDAAAMPASGREGAASRGHAATGVELRLALEECEIVIARRLQKSVKRLHADAESELEKRLAALATYYRELLAEEGDRKGRTRTASDAERSRRLKLEWERKISTERQHVAPRGTLRLLALEELWTPRSLVEVLGEPTGRVVLWDHAAGAFIRSRCRRCAMHSLIVRRSGRSGFLCPRCSLRAPSADGVQV